MDESAAPLSPEDLRTLLVEVLTRGAPAQQAHAQRLIEQIDDRPSHAPVDDAILGEALLLVDAFRNDPYLWR